MLLPRSRPPSDPMAPGSLVFPQPPGTRFASAQPPLASPTIPRPPLCAQPRAARGLSRTLGAAWGSRLASGNTLHPQLRSEPSLQASVCPQGLCSCPDPTLPTLPGTGLRASPAQHHLAGNCRRLGLCNGCAQLRDGPLHLQAVSCSFLTHTSSPGTHPWHLPRREALGPSSSPLLTPALRAFPGRRSCTAVPPRAGAITESRLTSLQSCRQVFECSL